MPYETERWPFIEARWYGPLRSTPVTLVVVHDMEYPERITAAEDIARDFANRTIDNKGSAHICVDSDSIIQCVSDSFVAYGAPGANHNGIHVELAGFGAQSPAQWRDKYSLALLALGADAVAQFCIKYGLPAIHLSDAQLKLNGRGIVGHDQVSRVFKKSTHTDPGPHFPWPRFMKYVEGAMADRRIT
jgi:hypothetical protein